MFHVKHCEKASLGDQGKLSAKLTEGIRTLQFAEHPHTVLRQNVHLLIPSGASRHLPLVTKGRLWCGANPTVRHAPLPPPLGEVSERSEDGEGK